MSNYMNRLWMATSVAVVNSHSDQGAQKLKSGLKSLNQANRGVFSRAVNDQPDIRPISGILTAGRDDRGSRSEESLQKVMYLNCWGPC